MKHELKIRAGDMPPQDIYQLSPSDIKQLLLDVLQPQHTGRYAETNLAVTFLHAINRPPFTTAAFENTMVLS